MNDLLTSTEPVTVEESGYQKLGVVEYGVEKEILVKTEDLPTSGGEGGTAPTVDLTPYAKTADVAATYTKKTDLTGAATATAADGLKLLLVDGSTVKQITLAELKAYLATT